jgi:hypothetical protein
MKKSLNVVGFIAALLMFSTVVMKSNHLPGAGIIMALSGFALSVYLPFFLLYKSGEESNSGKNVAGIIGAISASVLNLGISFKFMHWPGAGVMIVLGLTSFALVFIPMLLRKKLKGEASVRKTLMNTLGASGLTLFGLGILFKIQYWPGADVMLGLSVFLLFFGYFLMYMLDKSIELEAKTNYLRKAFFAVILGSVVASLILVALNKPWHKQHPEGQEVAVVEENKQ